MDLALSGGGQGWVDCRLQAQPDTQRGRGKSLLQEGDPARRSFAADDHPRQLCSVTSRSPRDKRGRPVVETDTATFFEVPKQPHRAGPSWDQIQNQTHARLQELRISRHHHRRDRAASAYLQGPVHVDRFQFKRQAAPALWNAVLAA